MSDVTQSPRHTTRPEITASWNINHSDITRSPMAENSPRGILKGPKTPDMFAYAETSRSQGERYEDIMDRRVSFASATRIRVYGKNETPNSPSHRTLNKRLPASSPEDNTNIFNDAMTHSPNNHPENAFISRLSGSPMDRRKRRRDMFGSPPSQRTASRPAVVYPEYRSRGIRPLGDDEDDEDDEDGDNYFMKVLSQDNRQGRKRLFDDEDDDTNVSTNNKGNSTPLTTVSTTINNSNNNNKGNTVSTTKQQQPIGIRTLTSIGSSSSPPQHHNTINTDHQHTSSQPSQPLTFTNIYDTTSSIPMGSPNSKTAHYSVASYNEDNTDAMHITLQHSVANNRQQQGSPIVDTADLAWNTTREMTHQSERKLAAHESSRTSQQTHQLNEIDSFSATTPNRQSPYASSSQFPSPKDSQNPIMQLTQEDPATNPPYTSSNKKYIHPSDDSTAIHYSFNTSSPTRSPFRAPFRSPSRSAISNANLSAKSPRVGMSVLESMDASPILPLRSPLGILSDRQPSRTTSGLFSPKRSFYLHDQAQIHSPLANNNNNNNNNTTNTSHHFSKSPLRHEHLMDRNLSEHSIGSDYGDRMVSMHGSENFNIFEEELPQLYDSFIADPSSPKPMTLSYFLSTAAGFESKPTPQPTPSRIPKQTMPSDYAPTSFDEQASAAASTLLELDAYSKLVEKTQDRVHDLTDRLQHLDEDLSQNNPQVFAEYDNASPEMYAQMENRFSELRKLAYAETEQEWYTDYISTMEDLVERFQNQLTCQYKDQQLLKQKTDALTKKLPLVLEKRHEATEALDEARKKVQMYKQIDRTMLDRWERDIMEQQAVITKSQKETEQVEEKESKVLKELSLLAEKKVELQWAISKAEETRNAHSYVSELDVIHARDQFESCSSLCAWKLENKTDHTMQFTVFDDIDVLLDTEKLANHDMDAVFIRMLESKDQEYGPFAELVHGLQVMAKGTWSQQKILQDIAIYWNRVRMIRNEITLVKRRFWVELEALTSDSSTDMDLRGFRCNINMFSFMLNIKFLVSFEIRAKQVMDYPQSIDLSTLVVQFDYGNTTPQYLDTLVRHTLEENGIVGLLSTLCSIIEDFQ